MPPYDATAYDRPAPVVLASLRRYDGRSAVVYDVALQIDTGADVTLLPRSAVARLGLAPSPGQRYALYGFDGTRTEADAVELDLLLSNQIFHGRY